SRRIQRDLARPCARPRRLPRRRAASGRALRAHRPLRRRAPRPRAPPHRGAVRLPRKRRARRRRARLMLQCAPHRTGPPCGWPPAPPPLGNVARRLAPRLHRRLPRSRRLQLYSRPAGLRQPDRDRLLGRTRTVFALTDVVHLLTDELPSLRRRRFALGCILVRALDGFSLWHGSITSSRKVRTPASLSRRFREHRKNPSLTEVGDQGFG